MNGYVVDASVAIKWYVPETLSEQADHLLEESATAGVMLLAPDLIIAEMGNIVWKKHRLGELKPTEAQQILIEIQEHLPIRLSASSLLLQGAWEIARLYERSMYDALYLALAEERRAIFITADERIVNALSHAPLAERVRWLGDWVDQKPQS